MTQTEALDILDRICIHWINRPNVVDHEVPIPREIVQQTLNYLHECIRESNLPLRAEIGYKFEYRGVKCITV